MLNVKHSRECEAIGRQFSTALKRSCDNGNEEHMEKTEGPVRQKLTNIHW